MITHNFTEKPLRNLIELRGQLLGTKKFQPNLADGCENTIRQINSELEKRGIKNLR